MLEKAAKTRTRNAAEKEQNNVYDLRPDAGGKDREVFDMSGSESGGSPPRSGALHTSCGTGGDSSTKRVPAPGVATSQRLLLEASGSMSSTNSVSSTNSEAEGRPPKKLDFDDIELTPGAHKRGHANGSGGDDSEETAGKPKRRREDGGDDEEKSTCARCLRVMVPRKEGHGGLVNGCVEWQVVPKCGHKICGSCWMQALNAIEEARTDELREKMLLCCGLVRGTCHSACLQALLRRVVEWYGEKTSRLSSALFPSLRPFHHFPSPPLPLLLTPRTHLHSTPSLLHTSGLEEMFH